MARVTEIIRLMIRSFRLLFFLLLLFSASSHCQESANLQELIARGKYLSDVAGCKHCHTQKGGDIFGGGKATQSKFGVFYSPNISSDKTQGIGQWQLDDFRQALTAGISPDGQHYYPVFPYTSYQNLTQNDVDALYYYLLSTPPSPQPSTAHDIDFPFSLRSLMVVWKWLYMDEGKMPKKLLSEPLMEGRYVLYSMTHCGQCHSPRTVLGGIDQENRLNGGRYKDDDSYAPSLLKSRDGIATWSADDLEVYLLLGEAPNGDYASGDMIEVIDHVTNYLTPEDMRKLVTFLLSQ